MAVMTSAVRERQTEGSWVPTAESFGARLALVRQRMGWGNVAEAAVACGLPVNSWRNWERDGREPHRLTVVAKQIAGATGVDYLWLVHGPDRGEGGTNIHSSFMAERLLERPRRTSTQPNRRRPPAGAPASSPVSPRRRRPRALRSPNRVEVAA